MKHLLVVLTMFSSLSVLAQEESTPADSSPAAPAESQPAESQPAESQPAESQPAELSPEGLPATTTPAEERDAQPPEVAPPPPAAAPPPAQPPPPREATIGDPSQAIGVVVMTLKPEGVEPAMATALTGVVATRIHELGVFRVTTQEDITSAVSFDQLKDALTCTESSCFADFREMLGADHLVVGTVSRAGTELVAHLSLLSLEPPRTVKRESVREYGAARVISQLGAAAGRVVQPLLASRTGSLRISTNEEGATVAVDGTTIGTTPLGAVEVPAGPHRVEVAKEGFIRAVRDVVIEPDGEVVEHLVIPPSPETVAAHKRVHGTLRIAAWSAGIAGVSSLLLGGALYGSYLLGVEQALARDDVKYEADANRVLVPDELYTTLQVQRFSGYALMGVGVLVASTGLVLGFVGEDPGRYDHLVAGGAE
jgi:hypothetical protein